MSLLPQGIAHGIATYRASAPHSAQVTKIVTFIYGTNNRHVWSHTTLGSSVVLKIDVGNAAIWGVTYLRGVNVGTYGHHKVVTDFFMKCGKVVKITSDYFNNDPRK